MIWYKFWTISKHIYILSHNFCFSHIFLFGIAIGKRISLIYKYDKRNWPLPPPNNNFFIQQSYDTSIQTQLSSASYYDSVGAHDVLSAGLDKSTNHYGNTDVKDNDDSQSFDTHRRNNCSCSYFRDTFTIATTPCASSLPPPEK